MRTNWKLWPLTVLAFAALAWTLPGCAQNQKPDFDQVEAQVTGNLQDTATLGGDTSNVFIFNDPASKTASDLLGAVDVVGVGGEDGVQALVSRLASTGETNELGDGKAGHIQGGVTVTVTMGSGTTPTVTGTATGSQTATGTQESGQTQTPTTEISAAIPVAVGAQPNASAALADRAGTVTQEVSAEQELRQALIRAKGELSDETLRQLFADVFGTAKKDEPEPAPE